MKKQKARPYVEELDADLRESEYAAQYLNAAAEEGKGELLLALRDVARARGVAEVAELAGRGRESLYKALSEDGNPGVDTLLAVLSALDLKLEFQPA